jgi:hypothetical protein
MKDNRVYHAERSGRLIIQTDSVEVNANKSAIVLRCGQTKRCLRWKIRLDDLPNPNRKEPWTWTGLGA